MRTWSTRHTTTRTTALALCLGVVLGGSLPDLGNLVAYFWLPEVEDIHYFNTYWLAVGLLGLVVCGITLAWRHRMGNTLAIHMKKYKWPILMGAYLATHIAVMTKYASVPDSPEAFGWFNLVQRLVPTLALGLLVPKVQRYLNRLANINVWTGLSIIATISCMLVYFINTSERWFAWSTLGLLILIATIVANNQSHLGNISAWLLGGMAALFAIGSWEILYQTGLLFYYDFFGCRITSYYVTIALQLTWVMPALIVILVLYQRGLRPKASKLTLACLSISVIAAIIWFANGMDIPLLFWQGQFVEVNEAARPLMISISRASQGFGLLAVATCFLPGRHYH